MASDNGSKRNVYFLFELATGSGACTRRLHTMFALLFARMKQVHGSDWRYFYDGSALDDYDPHQDFGYGFDNWWDEYSHELYNGYKDLERQLQDAGWC